MFADSTPDRVVDALRVVLAARANAELSGLWADDTAAYPAVESTIGRPVIRTALSNERLPMLSVVRRAVKFEWQGKQRVRRASMILEYYGPKTVKDRLEERWPMLYPVFECFAAALDGRLPATTSDIFDAAGIFDIPEESIAVDFNFADIASTAFPFFQMRFDVRHTSDGLPQWHEVRALPDLLELFTQYIDARPAPEQPAIATLTRTPAGEAAALASTDALDDDYVEGFPE